VEPGLDLRRGTGHATSMDSRTIELDAEAYEALSRQKLPGQSFSKVIKSHYPTGGGCDGYAPACHLLPTGP
jgi:hypothetical protein